MDYDPRYGRARQFALKVVGTSMNKIAQPGDHILVADWSDLGAIPEDNLLVVVRRQRGSTYEVTVKRLKAGEKGWELWPESTDPKHQEKLMLEDGDRDVEIEILGRVIMRVQQL